MNATIMRQVGLSLIVERVAQQQCPDCGKRINVQDANEFRDEGSWREFRISGLCQICQDEVWG